MTPERANELLDLVRHNRGGAGAKAREEIFAALMDHPQDPPTQAIIHPPSPLTRKPTR